MNVQMQLNCINSCPRPNPPIVRVEHSTARPLMHSHPPALENDLMRNRRNENHKSSALSASVVSNLFLNSNRNERIYARRIQSHYFFPPLILISCLIKCMCVRMQRNAFVHVYQRWLIFLFLQPYLFLTPCIPIPRSVSRDGQWSAEDRERTHPQQHPPWHSGNGDAQEWNHFQSEHSRNHPAYTFLHLIRERCEKVLQ